MRALLLSLVLACGQPDTGDGAQGVEVRSWFQGAPNSAGGILVVQVESPRGLEIDLPEPAVEGLRFKEEGGTRVEGLGERVVVTRSWHFTGPEGSYEIPALEARWVDAEGGEARAATSVPLFADLGVEPPRPGELAGIIEPPRIWDLPWVEGLLCLGVAGGSFAGLLFLFRRTLARRRAARAVPPEPADVVALRAWELARQDPDLDDLGRAVAIARIFRTYAEAVLAFPAESWTTSEIVRHLEALDHLPEGNVPRARRLLRATDRVKYADEAAREHLFDDLDADLRAFVSSTRARNWGES